MVAESRRVLGDGFDLAADRNLITSRPDQVILSTAGIELHVRRTEGDIEPISIPWKAPRHRHRRVSLGGVEPIALTVL